MRTRKSRSLTLVELLVAVALGTILVGVITFVWMQSNRIFTSTVNRLETYQRLRVLLDQVERDLANSSRTTNMEFFTDDNDNGHYDPGDWILDAGPDTGLPLPAASPGAPTAGSSRGYRLPIQASDPLFVAGNAEEFLEASGGAHPLFNGAHDGFSNFNYFFAPFVYSPPPYLITVEDYLTDRAYWRDEVMVRTFVLADGLHRPAVAHYRLVQTGPGSRSVLRRRIWYLDKGGRMVAPTAAIAGTDRTSILADDVCDFKVAFFFKENASSQTGSSQANGYWYHVGPSEAIASYPVIERDLYISDYDQGYFDALLGNSPASATGVPALSAEHVTRRQFIDPQVADTGQVGPAFNAVAFFYQGVARLELQSGRALVRTITRLDAPQVPANGTLYPAAQYGWGGTSELVTAPTDAVGGAWGGAVPRAKAPGAAYSTGYDTSPDNTYTNFGFPGVRPGDKVLLYDANDDDGAWKATLQQRDADNNGTLDDPSLPGKAGLIFPDGEYTVDVIESDSTQSYVALKLLEPMNFFRLRRHWLAIEPPADITVAPYTPNIVGGADPIANPEGPPRTIDASFNTRYRVGFLPAAFRVRISIDDRTNRQVLPMERVIRLLQQ